MTKYLYVLFNQKKKNAVNKVINKVTEDFKKIVAVTKLKELKRYAKKILSNYKKWETHKHKTNKN